MSVLKNALITVAGSVAVTLVATSASASSYCTGAEQSPNPHDPWDRPWWTTRHAAFNDGSSSPSQFLRDLLRRDDAPVLLEAGKVLSEKMKDETQARLTYDRIVEARKYRELAEHYGLGVPGVQSQLRSGTGAVTDTISATTPTQPTWASRTSSKTSSGDFTSRWRICSNRRTIAGGV
jgi:hypothetical protein